MVNTYTNETEMHAAIWHWVHAIPAVDMAVSMFFRDSFVFESLFDSCSDELCGYGATFDGNPLTAEILLQLPAATRAELIWQKLFIERSPLSENTRRVLTVLGLLQLDPNERDFAQLRAAAAKISPERYLTLTLQIANLNAIVRPIFLLMPNDDAVFAPKQPQFWYAFDVSALLLWDTDLALAQLTARGFTVGEKLNKTTVSEAQRFLSARREKVNPVYVTTHLPADMLEEKNIQKVLYKIIIPFCVQTNLPLVLDLEAKFSASWLWALHEKFPTLKVLLSPPANFLWRANLRQLSHWQVAVAPTTPSAYQARLRDAIENRGTNFIPFFSTARTPESLIANWAHARWEIGKALQQRYSELFRTGWRLTEAELQRDIYNLLQGNFRQWIGR